MKKLSVLLLTGLFALPCFALEAMSDGDLQAIDGQAGADLSLKISLNQKLVNGKYVFDNGNDGVCKDVEFCRIGLVVNNRYIKNGQLNSVDGNKLWMVLKGVQGTVNIQKMGLDGVDLTYKTKGGTEKLKAAMQISFDADKPIQIRNLGFNALAFAQDNFSSTATTETGSSNKSDYGFLKVEHYNTSNAPGAVYDHGRETGFMGLQMNGNLVLQSKVMMFGCDGNHPRC